VFGLNSCAQPTRGGPSVFGLAREKIIPDDTKYTNLKDELYFRLTPLVYPNKEG
jgi:hypothetical protein